MANPPVSWQVLSQQIAVLMDRMERNEAAQRELTGRLDSYGHQFDVQDKALLEVGRRLEEVNAHISAQDKRMDKQDLVLERIEQKLDETLKKDGDMTDSYNTMTIEFGKIGEQLRLGRWIMSLVVTAVLTGGLWTLGGFLAHLLFGIH